MPLPPPALSLDGFMADKDFHSLSDDMDMGGRRPVGLQGRFLFAVALAWSCYQLWVASPLPFSTGILMIDDTQDRVIHVAFALFLGFCAYPLRRRSPVSYIPWYDWLLAVIAAASCLYIVAFYDQVANNSGGQHSVAETAISIIGVLCVMEIARRSLGLPLLIVTLIFLAYMFLGPYAPAMISHRGASLNRAVDHLWLTTEGIFGIAAGVSTSIIFLFVLFGALLQRAGSGNYLIQLSFSLLGHLRGGPAKASVVASGLTGIISGSTIANIVTTGTFTIPLMKRVGYPDYKAGAIETSASLNGQVMPPVMGAAAFIMTEFIGITYYDVIKHAFLPAVISYVALYFIVHAEAEKAEMPILERAARHPLLYRLLMAAASVAGFIILSGLVYAAGRLILAFAGLFTLPAAITLFLAAYVATVFFSTRFPPLKMEDPRAPALHLPQTFPTFMAGLYFILPIIVLIWCLIVERFSAGLSVSWAIAAQVFILLTQNVLKALFQRATQHVLPAARAGFLDLVHGLATGARNMVGVAVAMAAAGIIIGVVSLTGVGMSMTAVIETLSGGSFLVAMLLTALVCIILGMGLPTTANYIVVIAVMGPVMVEMAAQNGVFVPLVAIHLFVFYFGLLSGTTPPVAIDAFVGAAIARADPLKTSVQAFYYSSRQAILPFLFVFNPQLLLIGVDTWYHFIFIVVVATLAMVVFAAALQGWLVQRSRWSELAVLLVAALTMLRPGFWLDMLEPPFHPVDPARLMEVVETLPEDGAIRLRMRGERFNGRIAEQLAVFRLASEGEPGADRLEEGTGMTLRQEDGRYVVDMVRFGSPAEQRGIGFDWQILEVQMPAVRASAEWFILPAFLTICGIALLQLRRKRAGNTRADGAVVVDPADRPAGRYSAGPP